MKTKTAMFGAGCFWGVQQAFDEIPGVKTTVGYSGGHTKNPSYEDVCSDESGHAEVVQVEYDPAKIPYELLLKIFFENHNPTELNRQGPDEGTQYRSVIFYHDDEQRKIAEHAKRALTHSGAYRKPIATAIEPAKQFYKAEEYHQKYNEKHGRSCHV